MASMAWVFNPSESQKFFYFDIGNNVRKLNCEAGLSICKEMQDLINQLALIRKVEFFLINIFCCVECSFYIYGHRYFVTCIDNASTCAWVYFMKSKDEVLSNLKDFYKMVENKFDRKIKVLRYDNGGEYVSKEFASSMSEIGIESQTSCVIHLRCMFQNHTGQIVY